MPERPRIEIRSTPKVGAIFQTFRTRRMRQFLEIFAITPETRILDVGGHVATWRALPVRPQVLSLNLSIKDTGGRDVPCVVGDGRSLPFKNDAFDVVFSNSVIEHLGDPEDQQHFASEIRRVGRSYYVQTPNRWFFVEPHMVTPFIHFLPRNWQRRMLRNFTVWGLLTRPTDQQVDYVINETRLLSAKDMRCLFPDGSILREKVAGMTKSVIAVRVPPGHASSGHR
jgi:hypothetical protein